MWYVGMLVCGMLVCGMESPSKISSLITLITTNSKYDPLLPDSDTDPSDIFLFFF